MQQVDDELDEEDFPALLRTCDDLFRTELTSGQFLAGVARYFDVDRDQADLLTGIAIRLVCPNARS